MTVQLRVNWNKRVVKFFDMIKINFVKAVHILTKIVTLFRNLLRLPITAITSYHCENKLNRSKLNRF